MFFGVFSHLILNHLKISAGTFNTEGGSILFIIALEMDNGRRQASESKFAEESVPKEESIRLSFRPLAVTLLDALAAITSSA